MIPAEFEYVAPTSVDDALDALAQATASGTDVKLLGGGQSLLPVLRMRLAAPDLVIDLRRVDGIQGVRDEGDHLVIGAMTTHDTVHSDPLVAEHAALLREAVATVADPQVRHRGTFGGSLVHADPAGDMPAAALALDAQMVIAGQGGQRRTVEAADFFTGLFTTAVGEDELLVEVIVPKYTGWGASYQKLARVAHAWAIVAVAAAVRVEDGTIVDARVGLTNMGTVPVRATAVEEALMGRPATPEAIRDAARSAGDGTSPPNDANGDAEYRRHLAGVLATRAVTAAAAG